MTSDFDRIGRMSRLMGDGDHSISREQWERACARSHKKARLRKGQSKVVPSAVSLVVPPWLREDQE